MHDPTRVPQAEQAMHDGARVPRSRRGWAVASCALVLTAIALPADLARAQSLPLKRTFVAPPPAACGGKRVAIPGSPAPAKVEEARRLFTQGQEAAVVGDHRAARDLFQQAAQLNASDERIPYYLGRSLEELQQPKDAIAQYCRYLALAPTGFDAEDVRGRLDRLASGGGAVTAAAAASAAGKRSAASTRFRTAVDFADRGKLAEAERGFDDVIRQLPNAPEAYYDRGVLRATRREFAGAASDFERYLALRPDAADAPAVRERLTLLRRASTSTSAAMLPVLGQFYTGRPVLGLVVGGAIAGGVAYALQTSPEQRTRVFTDPFGGTYTESYTAHVRKHTAVGAAIAGGSLLLGAIEGYAFAERRRADAARFADAGAGEGRGDAAFAFRVAPSLSRDASDGAARPALLIGGRLSF